MGFWVDEEGRIEMIKWFIYFVFRGGGEAGVSQGE